MPKETGAIQQDVPSKELDANEAPKLSPREIEMDRIEAARHAELEEESGVKFTDAEPATDKPAAELAKVERDAQPAPLDTKTQVEKQTEDLILDADTLSRAKIRVKIDGNEELVDASKALAQYQKGAAADLRLADATRLQREAAADRTEAATARAKAEATRTEKAADVPAKPNVDAQQKFKEAADALYRSEPEEAAALFAEAVAAATPAPPSAATAATPVSVDDVARVVEQRLSQSSALTKLFADYPEIQADQDFQLLADRYTAAHLANGLSVPDAIAKAGEQMGEKFKLGRFKDTQGRPLPKNDAPTTREQKLAGKKGLDELPSSAARASEVTAPEPTPADLIAEMAKARDFRPAQHQRLA